MIGMGKTSPGICMNGCMHKFSILQVSTRDIAGGAEKIARDLFKAYEKTNHGSWLAVGHKSSSDSHIIEIPRNPHSVPWAKICWLLHGRLIRIEHLLPAAGKMCAWLRIIAQGIPEIERELGLEDFNFPPTRHLLRLIPEKPNILHCHNLHGNYFDLRTLPKLSAKTPTILTLHDQWLLGGHCAHSFSCNKWRSGCGECPDIGSYQAIRRDASSRNWKRKRKIYARSRLYIAAPSKWLMDRVDQSMLAPGAVEKRIIPHGVDLSVFHPIDKQNARAQLNLPLDVDIVLFVANRMRKNIYKDYDTIHQALSLVSHKKQDKCLMFMALGEDAPKNYIDKTAIHFIPYQSDAAVVANYYQAADIYLHAAKADTFPNTILEALACGTPVIATAVGGISEQIIDGISGFLIQQGDSSAMADCIITLLKNTELRISMGKAAAEDAKLRFDFASTASKYLDWYDEILSSEVRRNEPST